MQYLDKEDQISDDAISSEEKWSLYVDQFVQLSIPDNMVLKRKEPFLKRNLPTQVGEEPPVNVETKSGLELKICVNTYKIFFVDNTEDYFCRRRPTSKSSLGLSETSKPVKNAKNSRSNKFHKWLDSEKGWKANIAPDEAKALVTAYEKFARS
jgi:paired amphipathic helix protein Sin3a